MAVGRIRNGSIRIGQRVSVVKEDTAGRSSRDEPSR